MPERFSPAQPNYLRFVSTPTIDIEPFSIRKSMAHQCAAIPHTWCNRFKNAVAEYNSATADVSVPNLRSQTPTHHQVFWLMQPGAAEDLPKTPRAASCLLMGKRPTMAAFRRKAAQLQIQLRGKPRIPTGFLLSPRHAAQRQRGG